MASSPEVEEIKSRLDIVDVIGRYLTLKKAGANWKANCPFHGEKTPSFMVNRERQSFRCFGCGEAGDIFSFVMKEENIDFPAALELLAGQAGVSLPERHAAPNRTRRGELAEVNRLADQFFHYILTEHSSGQTAREYLEKREVSRSSINTFHLGYAPAGGTLGRLLAKRGLPAAAITGAGRPDRFARRLMFPFRDVVGTVVGFTGRALDDRQPKYLNTAETNLFHKNRYLYGLYEAKKAIGEVGEIVLVEGQLDVVLAHQAGTENVVATSGTALTTDHFNILRRYADQVIIAYDGDSAGQKAAARAIGLALKNEYTIRVITLPDGIDPADLAVADPNKWRQALADGMDPIDWLLAYHFPAGPQSLDRGKRDAAYDALFPYLTAIPDAVAQAAALQRFGHLLGVSDPLAMTTTLYQWRTKTNQKPIQSRIKADATSPPENLAAASSPERYMTVLIGVKPELLAYGELRLHPDELADPVAARLYAALVSWYDSGTRDSRALLTRSESLVPPPALSAWRALVFDTTDAVAGLSAQQLIYDYSATVERVRVTGREKRIDEFASRIAQAEAGGDRKEVIRLMREMQKAHTSRTNIKPHGSK